MERNHDAYISPLSTRYASAEMQHIFSENFKFRTWRRLWIALAKAERQLGLEITEEQIAELEAHKDDINYAVAEERERLVRHDVMSHVYAYGQQCPKAAGIIHLGATSCYVGDNTDVVILREASRLTLKKCAQVVKNLAAFAAQRQFTGNAAHELRTPLALMQAQLDLFSAEHPDVRPETAEFLTLLREQTERLTQMTKTLLEMSNLQQVARNERIQLAPMVEEIFADLAPLTDKRGITLTADGDGVMTGSDALIYRLLFNLTENAVKYNRPGGSVRVCVTQEPEKLRIRVSDTGCGIPEKYQQSIFQPFFRVDKSRSREYGGAGLGLSLVWEIANLHGGSVWVEESSDKGTTIAVELPAGAENDSSSVDAP